MSDRVRKMLAEYDELLEKKRNCEKDSKDVSERMETLDDQMQELMIELGTRQLKTEKGTLIYQQTETWVSAAEGIETEALAKALANDPNFADLVKPKFDSRSLRTRWKEILDAGESISPEVEKLVKVSSSVKIRNRRS